MGKEKPPPGWPGRLLVFCADLIIESWEDKCAQRMRFVLLGLGGQGA